MKKLVVVLFVAGCTLGSKRDHIGQEQPKAPEPLTPEHVRNASRIVVVSTSGSLGHNHTDRYVFQAKGKCTLESFSWCNWGPQSTLCDEASKKTYELPSETFQEVQKILLETKYLSIEDLPGFDFEGGSSISVECAGRCHYLPIHGYPFGEYPPDLQRMSSFLGSLESRRKEIPSTLANEK
ncbi:MAG TPA: hypothetical protein VKE98_22005 [Gemmataceae bacterium]|nr:hypothetical protein [Gemmataceae bacterium]